MATDILTALLVVAFLLAFIALVQSRGRSLTDWAVLCLALAFLLPALVF